MYAAIHKKRNIYVAFHEDMSVIDDYIRGTKNPTDYDLVKIKKKAYKRISNVNDLYLMEYHGRYIPYKYLESASFFIDSWDYEDTMIIGRLEWLMETEPDLSNKDLKALERVVDLLRTNKRNSRKETVEIDMLDEMKIDYDQYQGRM